MTITSIVDSTPGARPVVPASKSVVLPIAAVPRAAEVLAAGGLVVVRDDAGREDEADLVAGAATMSAGQMAFFVRHGTGIVCVPMPGEDLDRLDLPAMVRDNTETHHTAFAIPVDHVSTGSGVCAADRAATVRALADPGTQPADLRRPGHVYPLRYHRGGVLSRGGHTEAAVDLLRLAGRPPVGVITELVADDGSMMRGDDVTAFAAAHGLPVVTVAELARYRRATEDLAVAAGTATIPTRFGAFQATAFRSGLDGLEHLALVMGDVRAAGIDDAVLVRVHSECLTGDVFGSLKCDCGTQLEDSLELIATEGRGVVVYLRGHEGRGIGLGAKLRAYDLQERGCDTVDANTELGLPVDSRDYSASAAILAQLGVRRLRLITNNPAKYGSFTGDDLEVAARVAMPPVVTAENLRYLMTKRDRMHHDLSLLDEVVGR